MSDAKKIIYSMYEVSKHYNRQVILADISLSYFYGTKIGVLGLNGSGKSTLLRIMAGIDREYEGTIRVQPGFTVGYLEQEPELEKGKTVKEIVEEGVQETVGSRSPRFRMGSAIGCIWPKCSRSRPTCSCSTSRPTTSTCIRCAP